MRIHWPYLSRKEQTKYLTTLKEKEAELTQTHKHTHTQTTLLTTVIQSNRKAFRSFR